LTKLGYPKRKAAIKAMETIRSLSSGCDEDKVSEPLPSNKRRRIAPELITPLPPLNYDADNEETTTKTYQEEFDDIFDDTEEDEESEYEESEYEYQEEEDNGNQRIIIEIPLNMGGRGGAGNEKQEKIDLKGEPDDVKKFVELLTSSPTENTIHNQVDEFKKLPENQKKEILDGLETNKNSQASQNPLSMMFKILNMGLPASTKAMLINKYNAVKALDPGTSEYYKQLTWINKVCSIPFGTYKELPVTLDEGEEKCGTFIEKARKCLDDAIYGQEEAKLQILQFITNKITNPTARGMSLLLIGPPGIGKTSLIKNGISKALEWPFQFISLGGDSDSSTYTGHQLVYEGSHCGKIVDSVVAAKSLSMVMMFDELDKISKTAKGEEVQNMLIHLTDPVQNGDFEDKYIAGIPIDLGRAMFVFSGNDITQIDRVLLDRMIVIQLEGYDLEHKIQIAQKHLIPDALNEVKLTDKVTISKEVLTHIIKTYAKEEAGVRELKRCLDAIAQKVNMLRIYNNPVLPYHIKDFTIPYNLKKEHVELFLKKKQQKDERPLGMYI
jgi:ATP-dependent Lon protease